MEISFIHMHILVHLNKIHFRLKGVPGFALKQERKALRKWAFQCPRNIKNRVSSLLLTASVTNSKLQI